MKKQILKTVIIMFLAFIILNANTTLTITKKAISASKIFNKEQIYTSNAKNLFSKIFEFPLFSSPKNPVTITAGAVTGTPGSAVVVPVNCTAITDLASLQGTILYDADMLTFVSLSNWATGISGVSVNSSTAGQITFTWSKTAPALFIPAGKFFDINFNVKNGSSGVIDILFSNLPTQCFLSDLSNEIISTWNSGSITVPVKMAIENVNGIAGSSVAVPVTATNLTDLQSFQWTIDYDQTKLTFTGYSNWDADVNQAALYINNDATNGTLVIAYNNYSTPVQIMNGKFFDLNFDILPTASGTATVVWSDTPKERELANSIPILITTSWTDGSVNITVPANPIITIDEVFGVAGSQVVVPVYATGIVDITSFQFTIDYDQTRLSWLGCENWDLDIDLAQTYITNDAVNGKLIIGNNNYDVSIGILAGKFFDIRFNVLAGATGIAPVIWSTDLGDPAMELASGLTEVIGTWNSGRVILDLSWDGSVDTDWQNVANWTPEVIPTASVNILIPNGLSNYPIINDGLTTAECRNMLIENAATITVATNGQMTVSGTITNNAGNAGLIVKSDGAGDGSLIVNNAVTATVERFITGSIWHLLFPTLSTVASTVFTDEGGTQNENFYTYVEGNEDYWNGTDVFGTTGWTPVTAGDLALTQGYLFNRYQFPDKTYSQASGVLQAIDKPFNVSYSVSSITIENGVTQARTYFDGWNMLGNPYPCAINWEAVTLSNIESGIYYFDGTNYRYYLKGGTGTPYNVGITVNGGSQYIPAGQGFFVKATATGTFTIPKAARVHNNQPFYKAEKQYITDFFRMNISYNNFTDETVIRCLAEATDIHESDYDAYKMFSWITDMPQIYTQNAENSIFAINTIATLTDYKTVPVSVYIGQQGEYTINVLEQNFVNTRIYLEDVYSDVLVYLNENPSYIFTSEIGTFTDRFVLHFNPNKAPHLNGNIPDQEIYVGNVYNYTVPENIFADEDLNDNLTFSATLENGEQLPAWLNFNYLTKQFSGVSTQVENINIKVSAVDLMGETVSDIFNLKINETVFVADFEEIKVNVYPVPASNEIYFEVVGTNQSYTLEITTLTGAVIKKADFVSSKTNKIELNSISSGVYIMNFIFDDNTHLVKKLILE